MTYSDYKELKEDLESKLNRIERGAYSYLGVDLEKLQAYENSIVDERYELKKKIKKCDEEMKKIEDSLL